MKVVATWRPTIQSDGSMKYVKDYEDAGLVVPEPPLDFLDDNQYEV